MGYSMIPNKYMYCKVITFIIIKIFIFKLSLICKGFLTHFNFSDLNLTHTPPLLHVERVHLSF